MQSMRSHLLSRLKGGYGDTYPIFNGNFVSISVTVLHVSHDCLSLCTKRTVSREKWDTFEPSESKLNKLRVHYLHGTQPSGIATMSVLEISQPQKLEPERGLLNLSSRIKSNVSGLHKHLQKALEQVRNLRSKTDAGIGSLQPFQ